MSKKVTCEKVKSSQHLEQVRANLSCCWAAAQLLDRIQALKANNNYRRFASQIIADALRDYIVMAMSRLWDSGSSNRECLSIPNLKGRSDLCLTDDQKMCLDRLQSHEIVRTASDLRTSFVAHSLAALKKNAHKELRGAEIIFFVNGCHALISGVMRANFDTELGWIDFDEELKEWEMLIRQLELGNDR